jgi:hypothetical protein
MLRNNSSSVVGKPLRALAAGNKLASRGGGVISDDDRGIRTAR